MNKEDIIRMARESWGSTDPSVDSSRFYENCERFAALVAAAEREACANLEYEAGIYTKHDMAAAIRARGEK